MTLLLWMDSALPSFGQSVGEREGTRLRESSHVPEIERSQGVNCHVVTAQTPETYLHLPAHPIMHRQERKGYGWGAEYFLLHTPIP